MGFLTTDDRDALDLVRTALRSLLDLLGYDAPIGYEIKSHGDSEVWVAAPSVDELAEWKKRLQDKLESLEFVIADAKSLTMGPEPTATRFLLMGLEGNLRVFKTHVLTSLGEYADENKRDKAWQPLAASAASLKAFSAANDGPDSAAISDEDGPTGIYQWKQCGIDTVEKMQRQTWILAKYLYDRLDRIVDFADLIGEVFEDELTSDAAIAKQGRMAKNWFQSQRIRLNVVGSEKNRTIYMERTKTGSDTSVSE